MFMFIYVFVCCIPYCLIAFPFFSTYFDYYCCCFHFCIYSRTEKQGGNLKCNYQCFTFNTHLHVRHTRAYVCVCMELYNDKTRHIHVELKVLLFYHAPYYNERLSCTCEKILRRHFILYIVLPFYLTYIQHLHHIYSEEEHS